MNNNERNYCFRCSYLRKFRNFSFILEFFRSCILKFVF
uniref:Uncharacterized protein n=1 Tax=Wuchereria bancrofti TaxID=6293 RepID=A0AAF5RWR0_WUCBA